MQHVYNESAEEKDLKSEKLTLTDDTTRRTIYFAKPSFDFSVSMDSENVTAEIIEQGNYMAVVEFMKLTEGDLTVGYKIKGKEYVVDDFVYVVNHNEYGDEKTWNNPLISSTELAKDLEEWLASYFLGDVEYNISWRGDPRIDAGDLMYLELKNRDTALMKVTENSLNFNGAWSSTIKGRKAVVKWQ